MPIKVYKPTSPGRRDMTGYTFEEITKKKTGTLSDPRPAQKKVAGTIPGESQCAIVAGGTNAVIGLSISNATKKIVAQK